MDLIKVQTSYFYQIRNFTPNMVPLSTAMWDPKWYYQGIQGKPYMDKRGIINGLRATPFVPNKDIDCDCPTCDHSHPDTCRFLRQYYLQLQQLDPQDIMNRLKRIVEFHYENYPFEGIGTAVLIFHEAPNNPCSERWIVQKWFSSFGNPIDEFIPGGDTRRPGEGLQNP